MSFASRMQNVANSLLTKYGEEFSIQRNTYNNYDVNTGEPLSDVYSTYTGIGNPSEYTIEELKNTNILSTDTKLYFYSTTTPLINDVFTISNQDLRVLDVKTLKTQGSNCLYILQLRCE